MTVMQLICLLFSARFHYPVYYPSIAWQLRKIALIHSLLEDNPKDRLAKAIKLISEVRHATYCVFSNKHYDIVATSLAVHQGTSLGTWIGYASHVKEKHWKWSDFQHLGLLTAFGKGNQSTWLNIVVSKWYQFLWAAHTCTLTSSLTFHQDLVLVTLSMK